MNPSYTTANELHKAISTFDVEAVEHWLELYSDDFAKCSHCQGLLNYHEYPDFALFYCVKLPLENWPVYARQLTAMWTVPGSEFERVNLVQYTEAVMKFIDPSKNADALGKLIVYVDELTEHAILEEDVPSLLDAQRVCK